MRRWSGTSSRATCAGARPALKDVLWERLRGSRFHGAKFRRQVPFDQFVVDFYCHYVELAVDPRTAIRGDGKQHESDYDAGRTEVLQRLGVRVIRFTNAEVCDDLDSAPDRIYAELRLPFARRSVPSPLPMGEGFARPKRSPGTRV